MAKLTLDKLEKHLDSRYQYMIDELPVDENREFRAQLMYEKHASGLVAQVERWVDVHARLREYAAFVTAARYVNEDEAATLRDVLEKTQRLVDFALTQKAVTQQAAELLQEVVERAAAERLPAVDVREAMKARILSFAGSVLDDFAAADEVMSSLDLDDLSSCAPASFYESVVAAFEGDDDCVSLLCGTDLHSPALVILTNVFYDEEIESFTPSEEHEDDNEDEEDGDDEEENEDEEEEPDEEEPDEEE